ncbi:hypothetical protein CTI12_AA545520 [Artemisia annua]|uniref:Uncharacterized protein n=1 Tax=Artemisia annua TaxID=35608 RepID=A0A2U1L0A9_ARTAN|nr:hypothetical protein CTI12_AA545520 [Artemisia annua]
MLCEASTVAHDLSDFDLEEWVHELLSEPTQATNTSPSETYNNQPVYEAGTVPDDFFNFSWGGTHNNQLAFGTSGLNSEFDGMKHQADADIDMEMVDINDDELMDLCENYNDMIRQE